MTERNLNQNELIQSATTGFDALLNNQLDLAHTIFTTTDSPFHTLGLGLTKFLSAALGLEQEDLSGALNVLVQAETASTGIKRGKEEKQGIFEYGIEYKLLVSTSVLCQALVHVLTESYLEFLKAVVKLNRSYKGFSNAYKAVFPFGVKESDSLATIVTNLNNLYLTKTTETNLESSIRVSPSSASLTSVPSTFFGSWLVGKKRSASNASALLPKLSAGSSPNLLSSLSLKVPLQNGATNSLPSSRPDSVMESSIIEEKLSYSLVPEALWANDPLTSLVISGAAFGVALFGLILSLLPPKLKKVIAWFGFETSRNISLKLLTVAATSSDDVFSYFASLALLTYYGAVLLMSGYQSDEAYLLQQVEMIVERVETRFPTGTLWVLNRAKLSRMKGDPASAITTLETALERESTFRQADSLLVFELAWLHLSVGDYIKTADNFLRMKELNSWSHSTYVFIAAGSLLELPMSERTPEICDRINELFLLLPSLIGKKRLMGEPPATELFIQRRINAYHAKHSRWIADGRLSPESKFWEVICVTPAAELGHFWNTIGRAPEHSVRVQIKRLSSFSPALTIGPLASTPPSLVTRASSLSISSKGPTFTKDDLDSAEEIGSRYLLLGTLYRSLGDYDVAKEFLQKATETETVIVEEKWVAAFATFELAVLGCQIAETQAKDALNSKQLWKSHLVNVDRLIDSIFSVQGEYNLRQRLESRAQMLRDEVVNKRIALGL